MDTRFVASTAPTPASVPLNPIRTDAENWFDETTTTDKWPVELDRTQSITRSSFVSRRNFVTDPGSTGPWRSRPRMWCGDVNVASTRLLHPTVARSTQLRSIPRVTLRVRMPPNVWKLSYGRSNVERRPTRPKTELTTSTGDDA